MIFSVCVCGGGGGGGGGGGWKIIPENFQDRMLPEKISMTG